MRDDTTRRGFLKAGFAGGVGLTLADYFMMKQAQADLKDYKSVEGTAKNVIFIYLPGGCCHQETWDPKPYAPVEYRGPMGSIQTNVDGVRINETLKNTAQVMDKITICRSMTHGEAAHERGTHNMFTGYRPSPALKYPSIGSVVSHEFGPRKDLPPYVCVPNQPNEFAGTGYLSSSYAPFSLGSDPAANGFKVRDLSLPGGVDDGRFSRRRNILDRVNNHFLEKEKADNLTALNTFYDRAYSLISSPAAREAFNIEAEDKGLRDRYGRNTAGQRMLMARRLVEAGVRFVTLTYGGWDMHSNINGSIKGQVPALDQAFARLIRDLDERKMLDETLVCISSEFGRTPKINATAGRDHWPRVSTALIAGGGMNHGQVIGETNRLGEHPIDRPVTFPEITATLYHQIGFNLRAIREFDLRGRPYYPVDPNAKPMVELV